jgi:uncharacterized tellurite resistance protein B-like protein
MELTLLDKSNYLKGLLIVAKKDNELFESEKKIIKSISDRLGFSPDFYEETIRGLLSNKYIKDDPIVFSHHQIAKSFISDGLKLAYSDDHVAGPEISWIRATAVINDIDPEWMQDMLKIYKDSSKSGRDTDLALYSII